HGAVLPGHPAGCAERLGDRLLGREPCGQRGGRELALLGGEELLPQPRGALQRGHEPVDVDDVDPDPDDHARLTRRSPTWPGCAAGRRRTPWPWPARRRRSAAARPTPAAS